MPIGDAQPPEVDDAGDPPATPDPPARWAGRRRRGRRPGPRSPAGSGERAPAARPGCWPTRCSSKSSARHGPGRQSRSRRRPAGRPDRDGTGTGRSAGDASRRAGRPVRPPPTNAAASDNSDIGTAGDRGGEHDLPATVFPASSTAGAGRPWARAQRARSASPTTVPWPGHGHSRVIASFGLEVTNRPSGPVPQCPHPWHRTGRAGSARPRRRRTSGPADDPAVTCRRPPSTIDRSPTCA